MPVKLTVSLAGLINITAAKAVDREFVYIALRGRTLRGTPGNPLGASRDIPGDSRGVSRDTPGDPSANDGKSAHFGGWGGGCGFKKDSQSQATPHLKLSIWNSPAVAAGNGITARRTTPPNRAHAFRITSVGTRH